MIERQGTYSNVLGQHPNMIFQDGKVITSLCTCLYVHVVGLLLVHPITLNNPSMIFHDEKVNISLCTYIYVIHVIHVIGLLLVQPITLEAAEGKAIHQVSLVQRFSWKTYSHFALAEKYKKEKPLIKWRRIFFSELKSL